MKLTIWVQTLSVTVLLGAFSSSAFADDRHRKGHHWDSHRHHYKHHRHEHKRHWRRHHHSDHLAEMVVGGLILGAVIHELAQDDSEGNYNRYTYPAEERGYSYYAGPELKSYDYYMNAPSMPVEEYLLDRDGQCYSVKYIEGKKILKAEPGSSCEYY